MVAEAMWDSRPRLSGRAKLDRRWSLDSIEKNRTFGPDSLGRLSPHAEESPIRLTTSLLDSAPTVAGSPCRS